MPQRQAGAQHMRGPPLRMTARRRSVGRQSQPAFPGEDAPGTGENYVLVPPLCCASLRGASQLAFHAPS